VSVVSIGSMFGNGWENNVKSIDALPYIEAGCAATKFAADSIDEPYFTLSPIFAIMPPQ
jgi:hypothetical protein